jgi:DNA-binding protein H-NS
MPSGSCGTLLRQAIDTGTFKTRTASMADYDLGALSLSELKKMQKDVSKAISSYEDRQKAEARAKVEALARDLGYSLAELVGTETKSSRAPAAAKYRHPENPALTWSGRGRKPQWFVDALAAGKTASELEIG